MATLPVAGLKALKRPLLWSLLGIGLLGLGGAARRTTQLDLYSSGGRVELTVAGSQLSAPVAITEVRGIEVLAMDSVDPPGGRLLEIQQHGHIVLSERLPRRFVVPGRGLQPLGDWQLDEHAAYGVVYRRDLDLDGDFELRATFQGRFHHDLEVVLVGSPTVGVALRRGLINNDMAIRVGDGEPVAVTSIDPLPWSDLASSAGLLLDAAGVAALLIALFGLASRALATTFGDDSVVRWPSRVPPAALATVATLLAVALSLWVAGWVLEGLPHMPDSVTYLLQSRWLLGGHLTQAAGPVQRHLDLPFTYVVGGRWLAQYPFGWPALLAAGSVVGLPWLVAPLLAAAYLWLLYLVGRELFSPGIGALATVLAAISPLGRLLFASMFPHAAAATLILLATWLMLVARRRHGMGYALAAGLAMGLAFGVRPLSAVAIALPLGAFVLLEQQRAWGSRLAVAAAAAAGGAVAVVPTLLANVAVTGSPFRFGYSLAHGSMYSLANLPFGLRNMDALLASTGPALYGWGWAPAYGWSFAGLALAFVLVPFLLRRSRRADWMLAGCFAATVLAFLGTRGHGLHGFGPRYYFEAFFALYLLTARGFQELGRLGGAISPGARSVAALLAGALFVALNGAALAVLPARLSLYRGYNHVDGSLVRQVRALGGDRALVIFASPAWYNWAMAAPLMGAQPDPPFVFATAKGSTRALERRYHERPIYLWRGGVLTPHRPPAGGTTQPRTSAGDGDLAPGPG